MRKNISIFRLSIGFYMLLLVAICTKFGFAQDEASVPAQQLYRMTTILVNPGMGNEFETFVKTDLVPALKKMGVQQFNVWRTNIFGKAGKYLLVSPLGDIASLDDNLLLKTIGQENMTALLAKLQQLAASSYTVAIAWRPDLGTDLEPSYVPKLGVLMTTAVAPGRTQEYEENFKKLAAIIGKTSAKGVITSRITMGGNPNAYTALIWFDSFADMAKAREAIMKGVIEAKLPSQTGVIVETRNEIFTHIPELGIQPAAQ